MKANNIQRILIICIVFVKNSLMDNSKKVILLNRIIHSLARITLSMERGEQHKQGKWKKRDDWKRREINLNLMGRERGKGEKGGAGQRWKDL